MGERENTCRLTGALAFAAEAHANQRRKGAAQEPYINHLIEVLDLVACATGGEDTELMIAALLHDVVEDTPLTREGLAERYGERVARIVAENSDDMSLPKDERRRRRIAGMALKSPEARTVKIADVISNLRAIVASPPAGWSDDRRLGYLEGCRQLIGAARGTNPALEAIFERTASEAERAIRAAAVSGEERGRAVRELEAGIGQPVHLIHMANTECVEIGEAEVERFCDLLARCFPSVIVQRHEAIYEGRRRAILSARIRTDSSDAVVALAQRICLAFEQRFTGVEVGGRYIRVYADDTG